MSARLLSLALALLAVACGTSIPPTAPAATSSTPSPATNVASVTPAPSVVATVVPLVTPAPPFPQTVLGLPVITVAQAHDLFAAGLLKGRDVAVAGYYSMEQVPCPYPGRYVGQLEGWCRFAGFADTPEAAQVCQRQGSCSGPGDGSLAPWFMADTLGDVVVSGDGLETKPIVVVGHTGDPRALQCKPGSEAQCTADFVADRVAWVDGVTIDAPIPTATLERLTAALGSDRQIMSAGSTPADGVRSLEPRWNRTGSSLRWVVRSIPSTTGEADTSDPTREVTVSLVDDSSGQVIDSQPLAVPDGFNPARLWVTASHRFPLLNGKPDIAAFYLVQPPTGEPLQNGRIGSGTSTYRKTTTYGPDLPLLLDAGSYTLSAWLSTGDTPAGPDSGEGCTTSHTFGAGDDVQLDASFGGDMSCAWSDAAAPSFGFP